MQETTSLVIRLEELFKAHKILSTQNPDAWDRQDFIDLGLGEYPTVEEVKEEYDLTLLEIGKLNKL